MVNPSVAILSLNRLAAPETPDALATSTVKLALFTVVVVGATVVVVASVAGVVSVVSPVFTLAPESKPFLRMRMPSRAATTTTSAPRAAVLAVGRGVGGRLFTVPPRDGCRRRRHWRRRGEPCVCGPAAGADGAPP